MFGRGSTDGNFDGRRNSFKAGGHCYRDRGGQSRGGGSGASNSSAVADSRNCASRAQGYGNPATGRGECRGRDGSWRRSGAGNVDLEGQGCGRGSELSNDRRIGKWGRRSDSSGGGGCWPPRGHVCCVCNSLFDTKTSLRAHIVEQQHFYSPARDNSPGTSVTRGSEAEDCWTRGSQSVQDTSQLSAQLNRAHLQQRLKRETYSCNVCGNEYSTNAKLYAHLTAAGHRHPPDSTTASVFAQPPPVLAGGDNIIPADGTTEIMGVGGGSNIALGADNNPDSIMYLYGKNHEAILSECKPFFSSKFTAENATADTQVAPQISYYAAATLEPGPGHADGQLIGTCIDMCPMEETMRRYSQKDVHQFEQPLALGVAEVDYVALLRNSVVKKYQRSAADHSLAIPHLVRTPQALLRTLDYLEVNILSIDLEIAAAVDDPLPEEKRSPSSLDVYLFLWNRYRMIAKDFILQNYRLGGRLDEFCLECHERMTRFHIMMDHQMQWSEDFISVHAQQNQEQLNNFMKTLNELYDEAHNRLHMQEHGIDVDVLEKSVVVTPNEGEFRSYYVLNHLDNEGEVEKYIMHLRPDVLAHHSMQFALQVVRSRRGSNYAAFFKLFRKCNYLQACCMFKYMSYMRVEALHIMNRVFRAGKQEVSFPVTDLVHYMVFEGAEDAETFVTYCGLKLVDTPDDPKSKKQVVLNGRSIYDMLPRNKSAKGEELDQPQLPTTRKMVLGIEHRLQNSSRADVCKGVLSEADLLEYDKNVRDGNDEDEDADIAFGKCDNEDNVEEEKQETGAGAEVDTGAADSSQGENAERRHRKPPNPVAIAPASRPFSGRSPREGLVPAVECVPKGGKATRGNKIVEALLYKQEEGQSLSRYSKQLRR